MRSGSRIADRVLVAAVEKHHAVAPQKWTDGYYDRMPLPELRGDGSLFEVAWLAKIGLAETTNLECGRRVACMSPLGLNILQQRTVHFLTRVEVPTRVFWEAFAHTFEEADLLQEWLEELEDTATVEQLGEAFERWIREDFRQGRLREAQQRASVRAQLRAEIKNQSIAAKSRPSTLAAAERVAEDQ
ncbi:MAG: hypothetical protein AB7N61_17080 [Acidimicrobiia bacterium]